MAEASISSFRKIFEGVAIALIVAGVVGAVTVTFATISSAHLSGRPFYQVAPYIAGVFCLCAIGLYVAWDWFERIQTYLAENRLKAFTGLIEADKLHINKAIIVYGCQMTANLQTQHPLIEITFMVFNGSVHSVAIEKEPTGFMTLRPSIPLAGRFAISTLPLNAEFEPRFHIGLVLKAWLNETDAKLILDAHQKNKNPILDFRHLVVTIVGVNKDDNIASQPLDLSRVTAEYR